MDCKALGVKSCIASLVPKLSSGVVEAGREEEGGREGGRRGEGGRASAW